jgi:hypothetical protein
VAGGGSGGPETGGRAEDRAFAPGTAAPGTGGGFGARPTAPSSNIGGGGKLWLAGRRAGLSSGPAFSAWAGFLGSSLIAVVSLL